MFLILAIRRKGCDHCGTVSNALLKFISEKYSSYTCIGMHILKGMVNVKLMVSY